MRCQLDSFELRPDPVSAGLRWVPLGSDSLGHTFGQPGTHLWNHLCFGIDFLGVKTSKMCKIDAKTTPETIWKSIPKTFWNLDLWTTLKIIKTNAKTLRNLCRSLKTSTGKLEFAQILKTLKPFVLLCRTHIAESLPIQRRCTNSCKKHKTKKT